VVLLECAGWRPGCWGPIPRGTCPRSRLGAVAAVAVPLREWELEWRPDRLLECRGSPLRVPALLPAGVHHRRHARPHCAHSLTPSRFLFTSTHFPSLPLT